MTPEQEPQPVPRTIEQVASTATEILLRDGYHVPMVIADGDRDTAIIQIVDLGRTFQERQRQMFQIGFALAQTGAVGVLQQAFHVSEAWLSVSKSGQEPHYPPSQDPNRKEALVVFGLNVQTVQTEVRVWEMIRDQAGKLTDLKAFDSAAAQAESPLLNAFVAGFALGSTASAN